MEESFPASSFRPPAVAPATTRYPPWVLLDTKAYFAVCDNATTAEAPTSTGHMVKVSFCVADPPAISHFCVYGTQFEREDFVMEPLVLSSAKDLVLLRFAFTIGRRSTHKGSRLAEYFVYKAGRGKPSLKPIPFIPPGTITSFRTCILPYDDDDDGAFVLADLFTTKSRLDYEFHVFSSKTGEWTITQLRLQTSPAVKEEDLPGPQFDKVIALGGGAVGWIDLWRGIISCNVFDQNPVLSFIPIPMLELNEQHEGNPPLLRDITCCNGFIKFVHLDLRFKKVAVHNKTRKTIKDLDSVDIIHDSELLLHNDAACANPVEHTLVNDGWKLWTCYRHTSWDYWRKGHTVDIDDILADNPDHSMLLPQLWDAEAGKSTLRNLYSAYPILGIDGDNIVYLMSKVIYHDKNAWMIGVDLEKKAVEVLVPVSSDRVCLFKPDLLPCEFSEYLNATPRSCAEEVIPTPDVVQKSVLNDHLPSDYFSQNKLPPLQNTQWSYGSLVGYADPAILSCNYQQHSSGLGYPSQSPSQVLNTDPYGQLWLSLRLDDHLLSQLTGRGPAPPPFTPLPPEVLPQHPNQI